MGLSRSYLNSMYFIDSSHFAAAVPTENSFLFFVFVLTAIWLLAFYIFDPRVTGSLVTRLGP